MAKASPNGNSAMSRRVQFCLAISEEDLGSDAPVLFQGGLIKGMKQASEMGFDAVEIHIRNPGDLEINAIEDTAGRLGLGIAAIGTGLENTLNGLSLTSPDPESRRQASERYHEHIELASHFGATVFVGLCRGSASTENERSAYLDRLTAELIPLAEYAERRNVTLSLEPIVRSMTNLLNTTHETLAYLNQPGLERVRLLMDTYHMYYEDESIPDAFRKSMGRIEHIHISDSDRKYPGSGKIDFQAVGVCLVDLGYDKAVSLEIPPDPDGRTAAMEGIEWMREIW
jgi:sugar phosphate isomerase/epimerase